jgi:hypothetical protein
MANAPVKLNLSFLDSVENLFLSHNTRTLVNRCFGNLAIRWTDYCNPEIRLHGMWKAQTVADDGTVLERL